MAGATERRVLIMGDGGSPVGAAMGERAGGGRQHVLHLAHPKTGASLAGSRWRVGSRGAWAAACYMQQGGAVLEVAWFKDALSSWLLGDSVLQDGSLFMATPIDAAFMLLPILNKSRMKKEGSDSEGMFRSLDEICTVDGFPSYGWLQSQGVWDPVLPLITDIREVGSSRFYRLNDSRVLAWLTCKVAALKAALRQHGEAPVRGLPDPDLGIRGGAAGRVSARLLPRCPLPPPLHQVSAAHAPHMPSSHTFLLLPCRPLSPRTPPHATLCPYLLPHPPAPHSPSTLHVPLAAVWRAWGSEGEVKQSQQGGQCLASPPAAATQPKVPYAPAARLRPLYLRSRFPSLLHLRNGTLLCLHALS
ncbi:unnamed protein product [Closterium sp. NIES-65]|nr:unnamed protein product [Closterium sp. NIES-65]